LALNNEKFVYRLDEGSANMVSLLGSKGAHASEMSRNGIPVPAGFVITTEACKAYLKNHVLPDGLWEDIVKHVHLLESQTGRVFGGSGEPLIVSVRSGSAVSMPGMMDTILNMGTTDMTVDSLAEMMGDRRPAIDAQRRFIQGFGTVVLGIERSIFEKPLESIKLKNDYAHDYELPPEKLEELVAIYKASILEATGNTLSDDPWVLLRQSVEAVFTSWNNPRAIAYRDHEGISHDMGTGCVIMAMVFGNLGSDSGTGVLFTRSPATGEKFLYGEFLENAQGEDVVAGTRTPSSIATLADEMPEIYKQIEKTARTLEYHYRDVQDIEFTVERGQLFILQTRNAKRTAAAAVKIATDLVAEGLITKEQAINKLPAQDIAQVLLPHFDQKALEEAEAKGLVFAQGMSGSPGAAIGQVVLDPDRAVELIDRGIHTILVRNETSPDDVHGIMAAEAVLTARGGMTSHAAVVTRGLGKPAVVGCEALHVQNGQVTYEQVTIKEGDLISLDGTTGKIYLGAIPLKDPDPAEMQGLKMILEWADQIRTMQIWANADSPQDAARARMNGAQGIGLCRTEHMFFDTERLKHVQRLLETGPESSKMQHNIDKLRLQLEVSPASQKEILSKRLIDAEYSYGKSKAAKIFHTELKELEKFQTSDFSEILKTMEGHPVVIRLLDAPLHEFLPKYEDLISELSQSKSSESKESFKEKQKIFELVDHLRESNPMLGHRGTRVGLTMPEVYEMQVRAIFTAAAQLTKEGLDIRPEIMIPIVSHVNELRWLRPRLADVIEETCREIGATVPYKFGTMIEVPRAALTASEIAEEVEFFSFGSNDLTQMTFAFSRDDAESKFLNHYVEEEILNTNPFESIDANGVGKLMQIATTEGRVTKPNLELGICGEHGGDPQSISFCNQLGLNYVSCSPFRVPVARLAAAQSALEQRR
tara:strand:+ start:1912 stop:4707 length:2796 start_codon:yes stop_codon:yes gene_type:complete